MLKALDYDLETHEINSYEASSEHIHMPINTLDGLSHITLLSTV